MELGVFTDVGRVRENNEDYVLADPRSQIFIVCDGMGGHQGGEIASKEAANMLKQLLKEEKGNHQTISQDRLVAIINQVNAHVHALSLDDDALKGMGTTAVIAVVNQSQVLLGHVGDSRAYILDGHDLIKLTTDHSLVQELLDAGTITAQEAHVHPKKNVITQALGADYPLKPQVITFKVKDQDVLLLCTDGVTNMLSDQEIVKLIKDHASLQEAAKALVEWANHKGGTDNSSVILVSGFLESKGESA